MNKIYFSKLDSPESFPKTMSIYCFHPAIARFLAKILNRIFK